MFKKISCYRYRSAQSEPEPVIHFKNQNYDMLKFMYDENNLFEDPLFPAEDSSMFYSNPYPPYVEWKRPHEAKGNPEFVVNKYESADIDQGNLGNCWFLAGCVGIMQQPKLFAKVVPADQSFSHNYNGMFRFHFWLYGEWVSVVIDDRLPYDYSNNFLYCSNKEEPNEYWASLLEKAYAKIYGSYESLDGGLIYDALIDMSGGIQEHINLNSIGHHEKENFWKTFEMSSNKNAIIGCAIHGNSNAIGETVMANGLVKGHAFTVTKVATIDLGWKIEKLLRIRNPWGNHIEWSGPWSDNSSNWDDVSEDVKSDLGFLKENDGEYWISYTDFMDNFDSLEICHLSADSYANNELSLDFETKDTSWKCTTYHSFWEIGVSAGGCGNHDRAKYWTNPQFLVKVIDHDIDDLENKASVLISLMQKDSRLKRQLTNVLQAEEYIEFRLYKVKDNVEVDEHIRLVSSQLEYIGNSGTYINTREVTKNFEVEPGYYLIIPSTFESDRQADFMLRIFTENLIETRNLDEFDENPTELDDTDIHEGEDFTFKVWVNALNPKTNNESSDKDFFGESYEKSCNTM